LIAAALGLTWAFLIGDLRQQYRDSIAGTQRETTALARGLAETTTSSFDIVDQTLRDMRDAYVRDPDRFVLKAWMDAHSFGTGLIIQATIVGVDGVVLQSSLPLSGRVDLSDREHVRVQKESTTDELFISQPVLGRISNKKSLNITRKIVGPAGDYAGTVVVSAGLDYMTRFLESLTTRGSITLTGAIDGIVRARAPADNDVIGVRDPDAVAWTKPAGVLIGERIVSYQRLAKYPLIVSVSMESAEVLREYHRDRKRNLEAGAEISVMFISIGILMLAQRRRLLRSRAALTATLENISQGILMVDKKGEVPVINRRAVELLGLPGALMDRNPSFREILAYQLATNEFGRTEDANPDFLRFVESGGVGEHYTVYERVRPNGSTLEIRTHELPDGSAVRTYSDTTERRRNETALEAARDAAEAGAKARSEFIAVMSHEIRTPLNGILGVAELLQDMNLGPRAAEYVGVIMASGSHLLHIINDVLDFSALDAARLSLEEGLFDIREVMRQAVAVISHQAAAKGLALTLDVEANVPEQVSGDAQRLRQIVLNLAGNGIKFTEKGSIRIAVARLRDEDGDVRLAFSVADTGIGISAEAQGRLFNEFTQGDSSIRRRFGGSGLGLAISRRLVEMMDGHISVESVPGVGSTFRFDLRLRRAATPEVAPLAEPVLPMGAASADPPAIPPQQPAGPRILLAEDNDTNRFVATRMLERLGYQVFSVTNGAAAVEAVRNDAYDLIVMDMMMPEIDGITATRLIRAMPSSIPIVGLTANVSRSDEEACLAAGMDAFVTKPVKSVNLDAAVRAALAR
jgi:signal transduction histidine kinase